MKQKNELSFLQDFVFKVKINVMKQKVIAGNFFRISSVSAIKEVN